MKFLKKQGSNICFALIVTILACSPLLLDAGVIGSTSFDVLDTNETMLQTITKEYDMSEDILIYSRGNYFINYVESDNENIKIEYELNKYCDVVDGYNSDSRNIIGAWATCKNPIKLYRELIKSINNKKIVPITAEIENVTVYTTKENIDKIQKKLEEYQAKM